MNFPQPCGSPGNTRDVDQVGGMDIADSCVLGTFTYLVPAGGTTLANEIFFCGGFNSFNGDGFNSNPDGEVDIFLAARDPSTMALLGDAVNGTPYTGLGPVFVVTAGTVTTKGIGVDGISGFGVNTVAQYTALLPYCFSFFLSEVAGFDVTVTFTVWANSLFSRGGTE